MINISFRERCFLLPYSFILCKNMSNVPNNFYIRCREIKLNICQSEILVSLSSKSEIIQIENWFPFGVTLRVKISLLQLSLFGSEISLLKI